MIKKERHEKILDMLKVDGIITIKDMMTEMGISDMTARRDLDALAKEVLLTRTHGGAQRLYSDEEPHEKTHVEKKVLQTKEKKEIAKYLKNKDNYKNELRREFDDIKTSILISK